MKKVLTIIMFLIMFGVQSIPVFAVETKIPANTPIIVYSEEEIDADDVKLNQNVSFRVQSPVSINNKTVIKAGTEVIGQVTKRKNNSILGIPGEIQIGNFKINNGEQFINLRGTITDKGENRAWVNVGWLFWVTLPVVFIKGNDGKIQAGQEQILYTIGDNFININ